MKHLDHIDKVTDIRNTLLEERGDLAAKKYHYVSEYLHMPVNSSTLDVLQSEISQLEDESKPLFELRDSLKKEIQDRSETLSCRKENLTNISRHQQNLTRKLKSLSALFQQSYKATSDGSILTGKIGSLLLNFHMTLCSY